jgi:hypothetical protein
LGLKEDVKAKERERPKCEAEKDAELPLRVEYASTH